MICSSVNRLRRIVHLQQMDQTYQWLEFRGAGQPQPRQKRGYPSGVAGPGAAKRTMSETIVGALDVLSRLCAYIRPPVLGRK